MRFEVFHRDLEEEGRREMGELEGKGGREEVKRRKEELLTSLSSKSVSESSSSGPKRSVESGRSISRKKKKKGC